MKRETILMTLNDVSDAYILEAAPKTKVRSFRGKLTRAVAAAACLCLVLSGAYGATVYAHPASYISLDVNPSIELCLNRWSRVIGVTAYNEEAKTICDRLDLKHKFYTDAVEKVLCDEEFRTYCTQDGKGDLTITIVSDDSLQLREGIEECETYSEHAADFHYADWETAQLAHENECSIGKYAAYEELKKYDAEVSLEDCNEMTMHELHEEIDCHHNGSHDGENELHDSAEESHIPETEHTSSAGQHSETKEETTHHGHH